MRIGFISDTHTFHKRLTGLKDIDLLIHAGDSCLKGTETEAINFIDWFNRIEIKHKVFIAGNHDFYFERTPDRAIRDLLSENVHYLNDSGTSIEGINIWGSPVQPWFLDWAFNRHRGEDIKRHWDLIPDNTDILITHGPPFGILDRTNNGSHVGCEDLLQCVERIRPRYHIFGHIHEDYGLKEKEFTSFVNASVLNEHYHLVNDPVILEY